jgi:hypothetical protein
MRERKRRHDDVHFPMGGRGKRATRPKAQLTFVQWAEKHLEKNPGKRFTFAELQELYATLTATEPER